MLSADAWLPRDRIDASTVEIVEHSAVVPELGVVFSMLWIPDREIRHLDLTGGHAAMGEISAITT
ncbi:MAG: hypothetical protein WKG01_11270 [Kofleriaceae bacterium]